MKLTWENKVDNFLAALRAEMIKKQPIQITETEDLNADWRGYFATSNGKKFQCDPEREETLVN